MPLILKAHLVHMLDEAKVYKDTSWNEYRVRFFKEGNYLPKCDYHTNDEQDARDTARHQLANLKG